jgi:hypothetical protein
MMAKLQAIHTFSLCVQVCNAQPFAIAEVGKCLGKGNIYQDRFVKGTGQEVMRRQRTGFIVAAISTKVRRCCTLHGLSVLVDAKGNSRAHA